MPTLITFEATDVANVPQRIYMSLYNFFISNEIMPTCISALPLTAALALHLLAPPLLLCELKLQLLDHAVRGG